MKKQLLCGLLALMLCLICLTGCGSSDDVIKTKRGVGTVYTDREYGFQLEAPTAGEKVAVMHTSMGDISLRFFPEAAPKAVENFLTLAEQGYYDGLTFHRVAEDFVIQGGDPTGTGQGGESMWGHDFEDEFDTKLSNLRGALSMANAGANTNGSQFFINQSSPDTFNDILRSVKDQFSAYEAQWGEKYNIFTWQQLYSAMMQSNINTVLNVDDIPDAWWDLYARQGGSIYLDGAWRQTGGHTVFGQVFDGMDVVDAIAAVEVDPDSSRPLTDVVIQSIDIKIFGE